MAVEVRARPAVAGVATSRARAERSANLPGWLALAGFVILILLPADILVAHEYLYNRPGGSPFTKLHPSTYIFLASFVAWLTRANPIARLTELARRKPAIAAFGATLAVLIVEQIVTQGPSGTAFIVDTLLVPWFIVLALDESPLTFRRGFFYLAVAVLFLNALIALGEAATGSRVVHLFGVDKPEQWMQFRSSAWLDHPLANAIATSTGLFAIFVMRDRPVLVSLLAMALALSLLAFGGRASVAITLAAGAICCGVALVRSLAAGVPQYRTVLIAAAVLTTLPLAAIAAVWSLDLGDRLFATLHWDDSADSRLLVFRVFNVVSLHDLLFGLSPAGIEGLVDNYLSFYTTMTIIENVWIFWMLQFGLILFALVVASLAAMMWSLLRGAPWPLWASAIVFWLVASGNNSLAAKTFLLSLLVVLLMGGRAYAALAGQGLAGQGLAGQASAPQKPARRVPAPDGDYVRRTRPSATLAAGSRGRSTLLRPPPGSA